MASALKNRHLQVLKDPTSQGQQHVAEWWSTAIQKEDPLHVKRDVLPIIYFIETEKQTHVLFHCKS